VRRGAFTVALIWEFVVALIIAHRGEGDLRWATIRRRLLHFAGALYISGVLDELSVRILLFLAPPGEG
jgi:hypothetical protein